MKVPLEFETLPLYAKDKNPPYTMRIEGRIWIKVYLAWDMNKRKWIEWFAWMNSCPWIIPPNFEIVNK